jgi:hypothetical protein
VRFRRDLTQVVFICWVATVVPYRICFDVAIPLGSTPFWIDAFIDLFFIVDVVLNFRTAYYLPTGFLETDLRQIRKHYIRTWSASPPRTHAYRLLRTKSCFASAAPYSQGTL